MTPSKYWLRSLSELAEFDLAELLERAKEDAGVRKTLLLGLVDEESDLTYYEVREAHPHGSQAIGVMKERYFVHFIGVSEEDRDSVIARARYADVFICNIIA